VTEGNLDRRFGIGQSEAENEYDMGPSGRQELGPAHGQLRFLMIEQMVVFPHLFAPIQSSCCKI
jgi:hypothetical protein